MPLFSLRITLCGKNVQAVFRSMWHETYDGNTTEITLQFIPVVAIINAQNLVLYERLSMTCVNCKNISTYMHAEEMLHSLKDCDNRVLNDGNDVGRGVRDV